MRKFISLFVLLSFTLQAATISDNKLNLGKGQVDKSIIFDRGGSNAQVKWNEATDKLQFTNDGSVFKDLGTGGGGGGSTGVNVLTNDSFEDAVGGVINDWSNTGGTLTQVSYTNAVEGDAKYFQFVATTSGQYFEMSKVVPSSFSGGCQVDFKKLNIATANLFKVEALDGSNNVLASSNVGVSSWIKFPTLSFSCPAAGSTFKIRVTSLAAGTLQGDKAYLGSNQNVIEAVCQGTVGCEDVFTATVTSSGVVVRENLDWISGNCVLSGTSISTCTYNTGIFTTAPTCTVTVNNNSGGTIIYSWMVDPSSTAVTTKTFTDGTITAEAYHISCQKSGADFVKAKPVTAVSNEQSSWFIDANIGGSNPNLSAATISSYSEIAGALDLVINGAKGSASAEIACVSGTASSGLTCPANESIGIAFIPPSSGLYEACFDFAHYVDLSVNGLVFSTFQVVETSNTSSAIISEGGAKVMSGSSYGASANGGLNSYPQKVCGTFNFSDTSKKTLRLQYEQLTIATVGLNDIRADRNGSYGQRDIKVTVRPVLSAYNRPILTSDQVITKGGTKTILFGASVSKASACTASPCTLDYKAGSNVTNITRSAAGTYALNYSGLSIAPICTTTITPFVSQLNRCQIIGGATTTQTLISCFTNGTSTGVDESFNVTCIGQEP